MKRKKAITTMIMGALIATPAVAQFRDLSQTKAKLFTEFQIGLQSSPFQYESGTEISEYIRNVPIHPTDTYVSKNKRGPIEPDEFILQDQKGGTFTASAGLGLTLFKDHLRISGGIGYDLSDSQTEGLTRDNILERNYVGSGWNYGSALTY